MIDRISISIQVHQYSINLSFRFSLQLYIWLIWLIWFMKQIKYSSMEANDLIDSAENAEWRGKWNINQ